MAVFFTSDTHFGDENIIKYCKRPFANAHEMDEAMIERWNAVVADADTVYHLGDVAFGHGVSWEYVASILKRLSGKINLVRGNHEKLAQAMGNWHRFESISDYAEVEVEKQKIVLFHYGMRTWHHDLRGTWHLYGHSHNGLSPYGKSCDVGVDCWNFTPVKFEELKIKMDALAIGQHPEFENYVPVVTGNGNG
jgi:calcineurin-like phosphoesterase family protein